MINSVTCDIARETKLLLLPEAFPTREVKETSLADIPQGPRQSVCRNIKDLYGKILRFIFKSKYWVECSYIDQRDLRQ